MPKTGAALRKWIDNNLIKTHIWVSINCAALALASQLSFENVVETGRIIALFFITLGGYHFYALKFNKSLKKFLVQSSLIWIIISILGLMACYYFYQEEFDLRHLYIILILGFFSSLYYWPETNISIRKIPYFKIFYIALIWTLWIVLLIMQSWNWTEFWAIFSFVMAITIPFDIRDLEENEKTLPQLFGIEKSRWLSIVFLLISYLLWVQGWRFENYIILTALFVGFSLMLNLVNRFKDKSANEFYVSFGIEGIPLIFAFSIYLFSNLV